MCLYRAYPCDFDKPNEYGLKENVDPKYKGRCTTGVSVECYCDFDNCNVDYNFLTGIWLKSEATDKAVLQCMTDHLHDQKRILKRRRAQGDEDVSTFAEEEEAALVTKTASSIAVSIQRNLLNRTLIGNRSTTAVQIDNGEEKLQNDESSVNDDVESAQSKGKQESDADESNVNDNLESAPSEDNGEEKFRTDESNVNDNLESAPSEDDTTPTLTEEEMTAPDDSESALNHGIGSADAKKRLKQYSSAQAAAENTGSTALTYSLPLLIIFLTKYLLRSLFGEEMAMM